jgi:hypothetical protein
MNKSSSSVVEPPDEPVTGIPKSDISSNTPPVELQKKKNSLLPLAILSLVAIVLLIAFPKVQTIVSEAAAKRCIPIAKVMLNPGVIETFTNSRPTDISVLAYDQYNRPVWQGVQYDWGISSINSIGTLKAKHDLATFIPIRDGRGDLYVKTTNRCTPKSVIGSVKVTVKQGVAPTPTIRKKK